MCLVVILAMFLAPMAFCRESVDRRKNLWRKGHREIGIWFDQHASRLDKDISQHPTIILRPARSVVWRWSRVYRCGVTTVLGAVQLVTFPIPADIPIPSGVDLSGKK